MSVEKLLSHEKNSCCLFGFNCCGCLFKQYVLYITYKNDDKSCVSYYGIM